MRSTCLLAVLLVSATCFASLAYSAEGSASPELPQNVSQWLNFQPVSVENLKGKGVVLYFFEEGCPRCKARWPELLQTAKQYEGKPVMFIAVNSGSPAQAVSSYAREVGVSWPVIVDSDRSLEKQFEVPEVSLQNIWQTVIVTPTGEVQKMGGDFGAAAAAAATGAAWKVDPASIPADLKGAWLAIELGNYGQAGSAVKKSLTSSKPDVKAAAEKLNEGVQKAIETEATSAEQLGKQDKQWQAYKIYQQIGRKYQGFPIPETISQAALTLAKDPAIAKEQKAAKELEMARKTGSKGSAASIRRAEAMLEKLVADSPDTEAAAEAQTILSNLPSE
jgi:thiol-disulfide isomerase/thioredoxin